MIKIYKKFIEFVYKHIKKPEFGLGFDPAGQDIRDYQIMGSIFGYKPKSQKTNNFEKLLEIKNQAGQNTCVCESGCTQKEIQENLKLSPQFISSYLKNSNMMTSSGTSLSAFHNALRNAGVCRKELTPNNYNVSWNVFSDRKNLDKKNIEDAQFHKSKSFWKTNDINRVLEQLDNGEIGHTGAYWYSNWNNIRSPFILRPKDGVKVGGHAFVIVDYDLNYQGKKVLVCVNSYGKNWADKARFYVDFADFQKVFEFGVYYTEDESKDKYGWLSQMQRRIAKLPDNPKCWLIEGKYKRYIPDEAILTMLGVSPLNIVIDNDQYLNDIEEGKQVNFEDIPVSIRENFKYLLQQRQDIDYLKDRYSKYYPDIFN